MSKDQPKAPGVPKCRRCNGVLDGDVVRRGGDRFHNRPECLSRDLRPHRHRVCSCELCGGGCVVCARQRGAVHNSEGEAVGGGAA